MKNHADIKLLLRSKDENNSVDYRSDRLQIYIQTSWSSKTLKPLLDNY